MTQSTPDAELSAATHFADDLPRTLEDFAAPPRSATPYLRLLPNQESREYFRLGELEIDVPGYEARVRGEGLPLTRQEFELLCFLCLHQGRVFTRAELFRRVWGHAELASSRTIDIHIYRLRAKLGAPLASLIKTVRGVGYKFDAGRARQAPDGALGS
jgi:DNA-binding response OmpR family regulator